MTFTKEDADRIFDELKDLQIDLDSDPLSFGPKRLNKKVSQVRSFLSRCERIFLDVSQRLHNVRRDHRIELLNLEISKKKLFANDPETRSGRSVSDREAIAAGKLQEEIHKVHGLEMIVESLTAVLTVVKSKRSDLRDTEGRLRDQIRLCQEEIGLGSRWGSKAVHDIDLKPGLGNTKAISEMTDLLDGVDAEIHLGEANFDDENISDDSDDNVDTENEDDDEDELDLETQNSDSEIEKLLVSTVTQNEADAFLAVEVVPEPKEKIVAPVVEDDGMEDVLKFFERD